jgi:hypothetical protein
VNHNLQNTVLITNVKEHNTAVVTNVLNPTGYPNLLSDIFFS